MDLVTRICIFVWGFAGLFIVFFNAYFLHIIVINRSTWTEPNLFIASQLVASFGFGLFSLSLSLTSINWTILETSISCPITSVCMDIFVTQSLWTLCGIAYSRKRTLLDEAIDSKPYRAIIHFIFGWILSIGLGLTNTSHFTHLHVSATELLCQPNSGLWAAFHIPLLFIFIVGITTVYYHILRRLQALTRNLVNNGSSMEEEIGFGSENLKIRIAQKKTSMRVLVALMVLLPISYFPYIFVYGLQSFSLEPLPIMDFVSFSTLLLSSITNPFFYAWRVPQIRNFTVFKPISGNMQTTDLTGMFWSTEAQSWEATLPGSTRTVTNKLSSASSQKVRRTPFSISSVISFQDNNEDGNIYHKFQDQEHCEIQQFTVDYQGHISKSKSAVFTNMESDRSGVITDLKNARRHSNVDF